MKQYPQTVNTYGAVSEIQNDGYIKFGLKMRICMVQQLLGTTA